MKKLPAVTIPLLLLGLLGSAPEVRGVTFADYWNHVRNGGTVERVIAATGPHPPWRAFLVQLPDGEKFRWDCGSRAGADDLNCVALQAGDFVLVNGHAEDRLSCSDDGIDVDNLAVPNAIYRYENGAWLLLTP